MRGKFGFHPNLHSLPSCCFFVSPYCESNGYIAPEKKRKEKRKLIIKERMNELCAVLPLVLSLTPSSRPLPLPLQRRGLRLFFHASSRHDDDQGVACAEYLIREVCSGSFSIASTRFPHQLLPSFLFFLLSFFLSFFFLLRCLPHHPIYPSIYPPIYRGHSSACPRPSRPLCVRCARAVLADLRPVDRVCHSLSRTLSGGAVTAAIPICDQ